MYWNRLNIILLKVLLSAIKALSAPMTEAITGQMEPRLSANAWASSLGIAGKIGKSGPAADKYLDHWNSYEQG